MADSGSHARGSYLVGDEVLYDGESSKPYTGRVTHVYPGGAVLVDWTCWPRPWFNGPYQRWEVRRAA